jgi:hypothetical protein
MLLDVHSPTELDLPAALVNFAGGFVLILGLVLVAFRFLPLPRAASGLAVSVPGDDGPRTGAEPPGERN